MKTISANIDLIELYNEGKITDEMLVALLFGAGVGQDDGVTPDDDWKRRPPTGYGFQALTEAYASTQLDAETIELFAAVHKWLLTH